LPKTLTKSIVTPGDYQIMLLIVFAVTKPALILIVHIVAAEVDMIALMLLSQLSHSYHHPRRINKKAIVSHTNLARL
jgi:hypothetical protein